MIVSRSAKEPTTRLSGFPYLKEGLVNPFRARKPLPIKLQVSLFPKRVSSCRGMHVFFFRRPRGKLLRLAKVGKSGERSESAGHRLASPAALPTKVRKSASGTNRPVTRKVHQKFPTHSSINQWNMTVRQWHSSSKKNIFPVHSRGFRVKKWPSKAAEKTCLLAKTMPLPYLHGSNVMLLHTKGSTS